MSTHDGLMLAWSLLVLCLAIVVGFLLWKGDR